MIVKYILVILVTTSSEYLYMIATLQYINEKVIQLENMKNEK